MKQCLRQWGISLLETVLVVVVSAAVLLVGIRYYSQARQQYRVAATLKQLDRIMVASNHWHRGHRDASQLSMDELVDSGLLIHEDSGNVWGGSVVLAEDDKHRVLVTMTSLPSKACQVLAGAWPSGAYSEAPKCKDNGDWQGDLA